MIKYVLDKSPGRPLYEILYEKIRRDILNGRIPAGTKLPSKRDMAANNDISLTTVINAYQQLVMEGYIINKERKGYFVARLNAIPDLKGTGTDKLKSYYWEDEWFADFRANNTLFRYFPFASWKKVVREVLSEYEMELVVRGNPFGIEPLRDQIANYIWRVRGIHVSPECIIIGAGIEFLYARLITLFPPATIYGVETPGYQKISQIYAGYHLRWKEIEMDSGGISMEDLRVKDVAVAHVSPEHHYPLGTMMPAGRRQELLAWAGEYEERYIIEDDFDCEFRYNAKPIPALKSLDVHGKVIYMNTFSKTLSPAVRISYMILPEGLLKRYIQRMHFFTNSASSLEQYTLARFIENGHFERHLNRIKKYYRQEGEQLLRALKENDSIPVVSISGGDSGTHLLVRLDTEMSDREIKRKAAAQGINVACLSDFCVRKNSRYDHTLVLNYSDLDEETQREAIRRIGTIFRQA